MHANEHKSLGLTADGIFGSNTECAVRNLQRANRLSADGIVGRNTYAALSRYSGGGVGHGGGGASSGSSGNGFD